MAQFTFADRYSEAGLSPTADKILLREKPVANLVENIDTQQIMTLAKFYYGCTGLDMNWFRDAFAEEDASFSLINNEREARVLSALVLEALIHENNSIAILAVSIGSVRGQRTPLQSAWLAFEAETTFLSSSVDFRTYASVPDKVTPTINQKLPEELKAVTEAPDLTSLAALLTKVREEARASTQTTSKQVAVALAACNRQLSLMHEESQMLWWLTGGTSKTLSRSFNSFTPAQAAFIGAFDLGKLTTYSPLGPVAIPAMLDKIMSMAKKMRNTTPSEITLHALIESFTPEDIEKFDIPHTLPPFLTPLSAAITLVKTAGNNMWHSRFTQITGLDASLSLPPVVMAEQLYREHLLGRLL
ncbi:hypothetical protein XB02_04710 [Pantoea ananatis]|nr:hypothetical protein XB02_04710 [Pantoea ananatis]